MTSIAGHGPGRTHDGHMATIPATPALGRGRHLPCTPDKLHTAAYQGLATANQHRLTVDPASRNGDVQANSVAEPSLDVSSWPNTTACGCLGARQHRHFPRATSEQHSHPFAPIFPQQRDGISSEPCPVLTLQQCPVETRMPACVRAVGGESERITRLTLMFCPARQSQHRGQRLPQPISFLAAILLDRHKIQADVVFPVALESRASRTSRSSPTCKATQAVGLYDRSMPSPRRKTVIFLPPLNLTSSGCAANGVSSAHAVDQARPDRTAAGTSSLIRHQQHGTHP